MLRIPAILSVDNVVEKLSSQAQNEGLSMHCPIKYAFNSIHVHVLNLQNFKVADTSILTCELYRIV